MTTGARAGGRGSSGAAVVASGSKAVAATDEAEADSAQVIDLLARPEGFEPPTLRFEA